MILPAVIHVIFNRLKEAGAQALLVGGAVGDLVLGRRPKDFDLEVFGVDGEKLVSVLSDFQPKTVGRSFAVIKLARDSCQGVDVDITLPALADGSPATTAAEAARRRDFSINSLAMDIESGQVIDPFGGLVDLHAGVLRATDNETFVTDPCRVLRACQLLARKARAVDPATMQLMQSLVPRLSELPGERVYEEWRKLLMRSDKPSVGLELMKELGALTPELQALVGCPQHREWHPEGDVWVHNCHVVDSAARLRDQVTEDWREPFMFGVLAHDFGKPATTDPVELTAHGHDKAGEPLATTFMSRLTADKVLGERVVAVVGNHLCAWGLAKGDGGDGAWRRLHNRLRLDVLAMVSRSDWAGRPGRDAVTPGVDHAPSRLCMEHFERLGSEPVPPKLLGRHLIAAGRKPGRDFTALLSRAYEAQLDDDTLGVEQLLALVTP